MNKVTTSRRYKVHENGTAPDRLPPHNVEAEEAALGAILIDQGGLSFVIDKLRPDDFFIERHGWIYEAMCRLYAAGQTIDQLTVGDELARQGRLDEVGHYVYLTDLTLHTPSCLYGVAYANIVIQNSRRRQIIEAAGQSARIAYDEKEEDPVSRVSEIWQTVNSRVADNADWQVFTLADAYQERPALQYVIDGLFSLPSLSIFYGAPGTMKSLILADALACVAAGLPWLEPLPEQKAKAKTTIQAPVFWADFDNGSRLTHERFEAIGKGRKLDPANTPLHYVSMPSPWLDTSDRLAVDSLAARINRLGAKMIVIDNLGTVSGGVDENSPAMIPVMSNLRLLAENTGAAVIVIHHQRKSTGVKGRAGDSLRGHSCIEAALDLALLVERDEGNDRVSIKSTKTRGVDVLPFSAQFTYEHKPGTFELAEAKFFGVETEQDEKTAALRITITECVKANPGLSQTKLRDTVKAKLPDVANHAIRSEILALADAGAIKAVEAENGKASAYYPNGSYVDF